MAKYSVSDTSLASVADAIRTKGGTADAMAFPDGFVSAIEAITAGGGGITQHSTGSLSSPSGGAQASFTVTGLSFRPVLVYFYLNGGSIIHFGLASELYSHYKRSSATYTPTFAPTDDGFTISATNIRPTGAPLVWVAFG